MSSGSDAAATIARAVREPAGSLPPPNLDATSVIAAASQHRVLLLAGWRLRAAGTLDQWPSEFVEVFRCAEREAVAVDCVRHAELVTVLARLSAAGVRVMLCKGAALAYTHYPAPHVRVRADTDLLVPLSEVAALEEVLVGRLGYERPAETSGQLVSYQSHYLKIDRLGVAHAFDVHWKISNVQALADRLTWPELWAGRVTVPALGVAALTIDDAHALLLALVHRAGHHPGSRNLLWIYDLHVLADRLTPLQRAQFEEMAGARGLGQIAADGLALSRAWFGSTSLDPVIDALRNPAGGQSPVVAPGTGALVGLLRQDLSALPDWRMRSRLIREHLLPSASYMRAKYGVRSNLLLPALYIWRVLRGAPKWLRRSRPLEP